MAQTLIGRLRLLIEAGGLNNAKKVQDAIRGIENEAKRLSGMSWGVGFQKQLDKLKASPRDLDRIRDSWTRLNDAIKKGGIKGSLRTNELSAWKTATISGLAVERAALEAGLKRRERIVTAHVNTVRGLFKAGLVAGGGYSLPYALGTAATGAFRSASKEEQARARGWMAGLSGQERGKIEGTAGGLAGKYRLSKADVLDMLTETGLSFPSVDAALKVSDSNARAQLVFDTMFGAGNGKNGVRAFAKSMDLLDRLDPDRYTKLLDNYVRAQQVLGRDIDPEEYYKAVKNSRAGGKVGSDDFMSLWLPMLQSEYGESAGTAVRAGFDQFILGRASKKAMKRQRQLGLRGEDGKLIGEAEAMSNPLKWFAETVLPALEKAGVNTKDNAAVAKAMGEIASNRLASDEAITAILGMAQRLRQLEQMGDAAGLGAADQLQARDPFAAWQGLKDAVANLSAAVLPMQTISAGLNSFADGINAFVQKIRDGDPMVKYGALGAAGIVGAGGAYAAGSAVYGLITAGANLNAAAFALQAAAAAQGGGSVADLGRNGGKLSKLSKLGLWGTVAAVVANGGYQFVSQTSADVGRQNRSRPTPMPWHGFDVNRGRGDVDPNGVRYEGGMHRAYATGNAMPGEKIAIDQTIVADAERIGAQVKAALSPTAAPTVDTSSIQSALSLAQQLASLLGALPGKAAAVASSIDAELRRAHSDYGVAP
jgi:hypothetical protein